MATSPPVAPVLVVDDDKDIRELVRVVLETEGFPVVTAPNGDDALRILDTSPVSLLVIDQMMPGLSGTDVVARLRRDSPTATLPVLMLTSLAGGRDVVRGLDSGVDDYMTKPFAPDELVARVRARLREADAWRARLNAEAAVRADVTAAMQQLAGSVPDQAGVICGELCNLAGVTGAAVVALLPDGTATVVAASGGHAGGRVLPAGFREYLVANAPRVRWLVAAEEPYVAPVFPALPGDAATAAAALRDGDTVVGALLIRTTGQRSAEDAAVLALEVADDFGDLLSRLLAPQLQGLLHTHSDRSMIADVIADRRFYPVYQPVIDLRTSRPVGYEALTRFAEGQSPESFFDEAKRLGLGTRAEEVTATAAIDGAGGLPDGAWLSVNVTPETLMQPRALAEPIRRAGRPIVVEITERSAIADYAQLASCLRELGGAVRIAVDDTGSGYASLRHVLEMQPAFVKLDRDWVHGINRDERRRGVVGGVVHMAAKIGTEIIAEGVETAAELDTLRGLGVRLGQGYLLGKPEPAA